MRDVSPSSRRCRRRGPKCRVLGLFEGGGVDNARGIYVSSHRIFHCYIIVVVVVACSRISEYGTSGKAKRKGKEREGYTDSREEIRKGRRVGIMDHHHQPYVALCRVVLCRVAASIPESTRHLFVD